MHLNTDLHMHPTDTVSIKTTCRDDGETYPTIKITGKGANIFPCLTIWPGSFDDLRKLRDQITDYLDSLAEPDTVELPALPALEPVGC